MTIVVLATIQSLTYYRERIMMARSLHEGARRRPVVRNNITSRLKLNADPRVYRVVSMN